jgi:hypothetical protein
LEQQMLALMFMNKELKQEIESISVAVLLMFLASPVMKWHCFRISA